MTSFRYLVIFVLLLQACAGPKNETQPDHVIANGQMPNLAKDASGNLGLVYGSGDSLLYQQAAADDVVFSSPQLIARLPHLAASHTRGPQVAATTNGLLVTACTAEGNIFSFVKDANGRWQQTGRVTDRDTMAKENLMALAASGNNAFAVWLDLRDGQNQLYGARSTDGGRTWSKNLLVYASPDTSVCECCRPAVQMQGSNVYVQFRNRIAGNRDLYLVKSGDGGSSFGAAQKLGTGTWKLNACPMDGGALAVLPSGGVQTVWRREATIFAAIPGAAEQALGTGKGCTVEVVNNAPVYAWTEDGNVVVQSASGKQLVGKGSSVVLKAINNNRVLCVWELEKQVHAAVVAL